MSSAAASAPPTMKLLVDTGAQRVLFAEAGKDAVDFIFGLLAMPLGAAGRLLAGDGALGSIASVYASVEEMDAAYVQSAAARDALLLDPAAPPPPHPSSPSAANASSLSAPAPSMSTSLFAPAVPPLLLPMAPLLSTAPVGFFTHGVMREVPRPLTTPPPLPPPLSTSIDLRPDPKRALPLYVAACYAARLPSKGSGGFVKGAAMPYTVMDDLTVTPPSSASGAVALLKNLGVKDLDAVEERTIGIGDEEALAILKAAVHSKTVLTDAFLPKTKRARISDDRAKLNPHHSRTSS